MTRDLIYEDNKGNRLMKDLDNRLIVLNKFNSLVEADAAKKFISQTETRIAMKRYFGGKIPYIKILNKNQTKYIRKKVDGGFY